MGILDKFSLNNHVVVVTGATGVLGKSFVDALAEAGAKVACAKPKLKILSG